ncbi:hypothetical protein Patl1_05836 [Pistacia atlantica]|uniref:Uncharacterized protein n=1 Tax=Pistacia atlantica TaxID=434234 RepID=A0ACC1BT74_9ROSI|nr:hypothetical protein Patl1_05836 [Pistacia atlantica]
MEGIAEGGQYKKFEVNHSGVSNFWGGARTFRDGDIAKAANTQGSIVV